ncbi:hypothetical protein K0M31_000149 [Melipona bicolor]|uniref:Uncharacterized protein n=1 Tax=Melipona bicolor TaxID=60889 RepID=A0AA40GD11_9HYME|nr:hypothetical protein K0M31_000149 [Melipona bicolor]
MFISEESLFSIERQSSSILERPTNRNDVYLLSPNVQITPELSIEPRPRGKLLWKNMKSVPGIGGSIGEASIAFRVFRRFISSTFPLTFVGRLTNDKGSKNRAEIEMKCSIWKDDRNKIPF